jgi:predicted Rossmann-fold nucleotide-binding protein
MKILVCGGRDFTNKKALYEALDVGSQGAEEVLIIHGGAKGADSLAQQWADEKGWPCQYFPADWDKNGTAAGPMRNQKMLDVGKPDLVVAFPGGRGTTDMKKRTLKMNMALLEIKCPLKGSS